MTSEKSCLKTIKSLNSRSIHLFQLTIIRLNMEVISMAKKKKMKEATAEEEEY
jgi:hypothetical protein